MFIMDVPYIPAQETPIVLAQAAAPAAGATPSPDFLFNVCKETESTGDPSSAMRTVDPAGMLAAYFENHSQRSIDVATEATIKTTLLQDTKYGKITSVIDNTGRPWYAYDAEPNYIGNDRAIFQAEFEGKVYKIVLELRVFLMVNEYEPTCPPPKLIKVKKPATGSSGYDMGSVTVTFADLAGGAAGHNWYIDTTRRLRLAGRGPLVDLNTSLGYHRARFHPIKVLRVVD